MHQKLRKTHKPRIIECIYSRFNIEEVRSSKIPSGPALALQLLPVVRIWIPIPLHLAASHVLHAAASHRNRRVGATQTRLRGRRGHANITSMHGLNMGAIDFRKFSGSKKILIW